MSDDIVDYQNIMQPNIGRTQEQRDDAKNVADIIVTLLRDRKEWKKTFWLNCSTGEIT